MGQVRTFPSTVVSNHDGDTLTVMADLGFDVWRYVDVRLMVDARTGLNAIELDQPGGPEARDALARLLPAGTPVVLTAYGWDKYGGRTDGSLALADGRNVGQIMVDTGFAAAWNGKGQRPTPKWPK